MKRIIVLITLIVLCFAINLYAADTALDAMNELTAVADGDLLYIVDITDDSDNKITALNLFDMIKTFALLDTIVADKSLINLEDGGTFTGNIIANANLSVGNATTSAGVLTILEDDDDGANFASFTVPALGANTVYILPPDDGDNTEVLQTNGSGTLTWVANAGGATAWDDIGDPDNAGLTTITFDNAELTLFTGDNDAAVSFMTIQNSDGDHTGGNMYLLDLDYSADDGDVDADYIKCQDSGGVVFTVQEDGKVAGSSFTDGTATLTGGALTGLTTALTVAQGGTGATSLNDGFVLLGSNTAAITPLDVTTDGAIIIGDGTTDPVTLDVGSSTAITILGTVATGTWEATAIDHERGGLEADVSSYSGLVAIAGGSTAEIDDKSELEGQIADVADFAEADGDVYTNNHDFGSADLEIPQASPAVPNVDGEIEVDFTDGKLVIQHGSAHAELGASTDVAMGTLIKSWNGTIYEPDGVNDVITVKAINSIEFPHGVVITAIYLGVSEDSNYTLTVQNFDDFDTINAGDPTIATVAYSADATGEIIDSSPTYATIAAGQIIMISIPSTDVDWIHFEIYYYEPAA